MIQIIEENSSVLLGICPSCLSKFTLEEDDIEYLEIHNDMRGVYCPVCYEIVTTSNIQRVSTSEVKKIESEGKNEG